ncbi:MAG: hypothetical protein HYX76_14290 [Acidobacteria bacterium]|nr:hypothetical protein [Acidobacteriota bacterium]
MVWARVPVFSLIVGACLLLPAAAEPTVDACALLTGPEVEAVQASRVTDANGSVSPSGSLVIARCFYRTETFSKSINLSVTFRNLNVKTPYGAREFWKTRFHLNVEREDETGRSGQDKRADGRQERERKGQPLKRISGLGEEAFWVGEGDGGSLYVLKGDRFLRLSVGDVDDDATRLKKMKALGAKAVARMK